MSGVRIEKIGPYELLHPDGFPAITEDPFHLVDFLINSPDIDKARSIIDIGTATGVIPMLLAARSDISHITGVEIDADTAGCARENMERSGLEERIEILHLDYRELPNICEAGSFDIVVSNPPYIKAGQGRESDDERRAKARYERFGSLKELIEVSKRLLSEGGRLFLIFPILRKNELLNELRSNGFSVIRKELVACKDGNEPKLFMVEAGREMGTAAS